MTWAFVQDERLGIPLPHLDKEWDEYSDMERSDILLEWEQIRGTIPDRIKRLEQIIIRKQNQLNVEENFKVSCELNSDIAELAGTINELHLWFRMNQDVAASASHH